MATAEQPTVVYVNVHHGSQNEIRHFIAYSWISIDFGQLEFIRATHDTNKCTVSDFNSLIWWWTGQQTTTMTMTIKRNASRTINTRNKNPWYIATQDFLLFFNLCVYTIFTVSLHRCHRQQQQHQRPDVRVYVCVWHTAEGKKKHEKEKTNQHWIATTTCNTYHIYYKCCRLLCIFVSKNGLLWLTTQQEWYAMVIERVSILVCTYHWNCVHFDCRTPYFINDNICKRTMNAHKNAHQLKWQLNTLRAHKRNVSFWICLSHRFIHTFCKNSHECKAVRCLHVVFTIFYLSVS